MKTAEERAFVRIRKRPWYMWFFRLVWLLWLIFWVDMALGSWKEFEYRAFAIALGVFLASLGLGLLLWLLGYRKGRRVSGQAQ